MVPTEDTMDPRRRFGRRSARATSGETPEWPATGGAPVPGGLLPVEGRGWRARSKVRAIVGVLVDPGLTSDKNGFLPFDAIAPQLAAAHGRNPLPPPATPAPG